jgi:hypothetical protein
MRINSNDNGTPLLSPDARSDAPASRARQRPGGRRQRPPRPGQPVEVRDPALSACADAAVDAMASWGFVWIRDPCGCDGSGYARRPNASLEPAAQVEKCRCAGQGRVWYPQGRRAAVQLNDRQLVQLYVKEKAKRL